MLRSSMKYALLLAVAGSCSVFAEPPMGKMDDTKPVAGQQADQDHKMALQRASDVIGANIYNDKTESLGKVDDLVLAGGESRISYAVLSYGGILGIGDKLFAVPWEALTVNTADHEFVLNVDKQVLENAPGFDKDNWPDMAEPGWGSEIHGHYGKKPYWNTNVTDAGNYTGDDRLDKPDRDKDFEASGAEFKPKY